MTSSSHVGPIVFSNITARTQLLEHDFVVTFRSSERTTGSTWWRKSRTGKKQGDVIVEQLANIALRHRLLRPTVKFSGFDSTAEWLSAIRSFHGDSISEGVLYLVYTC